LNDYDTVITIGVGSLSAIRLWSYENGIIEKTQPKYTPLEWKVNERLESTRTIRWFVLVGIRKDEPKIKIQLDETQCSILENLSVSSA
jgi:hypothetical protein